MAQEITQETNIVSGMHGRYAQALYALAVEQKATEQVAADLSTFSALIAESADLQRFIKSPVFSAEDQVKALTALLARAGITGTRRQFLQARRRQAPALRDRRHDRRLS